MMQQEALTRYQCYAFGFLNSLNWEIKQSFRNCSFQQFVTETESGLRYKSTF